MNRPLSFILLLTSCLTAVPLVASQTNTPDRGSPPAVKPSKSDPPPADNEPAAKVIQYSDHDVVRVRTKLRYTTLIVLPKEEVILDFVCGDKDLWVISGDQNFAYVKPAKENAQTNLNLITASGNVYSFVLSEVTGNSASPPDLKVFVELADPAMADTAAGTRRFVSAGELETYRQQAQVAKDEARQAKEHTEAAVDERVKRFLTNVRFAYRFEANKKPFYVRAIYRDDVRTYIEARPEETPTIYELKDGKPNLVNFSYDGGIYVTDRILESGYLVVGKKRLQFYREE